uniref:Uncharacterized protein n=1 Tax=Rhizophora mucronata TaxID=61149 RepID=A0A2P2N688_RHIMU
MNKQIIAIRSSFNRKLNGKLQNVRLRKFFLYHSIQTEKS